MLAADNVPKEGLRIEDVLVRIGTLSLIRDKVCFVSWIRNINNLFEGLLLVQCHDILDPSCTIAYDGENSFYEMHV